MDVRLPRRKLAHGEWLMLGGLPVTVPQRIGSDLLWDNEDPDAVAHIIDHVITKAYADPASFPSALAPHEVRLGLGKEDGLALLRALRSNVGDPDWEKSI